MIPVPLSAITYPPELPVSAAHDEIVATLRDNQVVIVAGATGSGKTTQLPKMLLELGYESIGHTQPRRLAARTIAERIAEELGTDLGDLVGYQVRFTDTVGANTRIKLMTDGILLNEIHRDRDLKKYDAIIIDEAHERSLTVDFLIGYLKQLLPRRPDLKVVITSATIDPESFSRHFSDERGDGAPIIEVSGRTYPVEIRYRPLVASDAGASTGSASDAASEDLDQTEGISRAIDELMREADGDILVFLSGEAEIRDAEDAIRARRLPGVEILPLYGRLSSADQHRVFERGAVPGVRRRVVLATNVAETSLTVPGIRYVIDAGTARISRYSVRSKIQRLPIEAISQASANQRSGRSGRTSPGIAIRLYSEEDFAKRPEFTEPEILRTNLAAVILQMISLGLGDIAAFPFLQPPDSRGVKDGLDLLTELGAVELGATSLSGRRRDPSADGRPGHRPDEHRITKTGRDLARLPIDPRLGRMVVESKHNGVSRDVIAIVAGLSILDPRERPLERRAHADQLHARFTDPASDFLSLLNLWRYGKAKQRELSGNQFRRLLKSEYINFLRFREWEDVYRQLTRMAKPLGLTIAPDTDDSVDSDGVHRSILAGLLSQIGIRDTAKRDYVGARQTRFTVFPGSALAKKQPAAIMSAELVETSRLFARVNAAIDPEWAEPIAGDLVKRSYAEPHWARSQGAAIAYEKVTLYGVPIVQKRRVQFARVDPATARDLFIRHALVEGDWDVSRIDRRVTAFDRANRALRKELEEVEERTRRRDILFDDEAVFRFYDERLPEDIASTRSFESWWRKARTQTPDLLTMTAEVLVDEQSVPELAEGQFPNTWEQGEQRLAISYRFEPGAEDDGVTVRIPLPLLPSVRSVGFDWLVPGLREDLFAAHIKVLPKAIRRNVVPANDWARRFLDAVPANPDVDELPLVDFLAAQIRGATYTPVSVEDFELDRLPDHLRMTFAVVDQKGAVLARSKDLSSLRLKLATRTRASVVAVSKPAPNAIERDGITTWDVDELPRTVETKHGTGTVRAYPAFVDHGTSVAIELQTTAEAQERAMLGGIRRLLLLAIPSPTAYVQEHLTGPEKLMLAASPYRSTKELFEDSLRACIDAVVTAPFYTREEFEAARDRVNDGLLDRMFSTVALVSQALTAVKDAEKAIGAASSMALIAPLADAREQLAGLVHPGFVSAAGLEQLPRIPVYLRGIASRVGKLAENVGRDRAWMAEVEEATRRYVSAGGDLPLQTDAPAHIRHARWMLEEFRLSLFAQELRTAEPVSLQRITKVLEGAR